MIRKMVNSMHFYDKVGVNFTFIYPIFIHFMFNQYGRCFIRIFMILCPNLSTILKKSFLTSVANGFKQFLDFLFRQHFGFGLSINDVTPNFKILDPLPPPSTQVGLKMTPNLRSLAPFPLMGDPIYGCPLLIKTRTLAH